MLQSSFNMVDLYDNDDCFYFKQKFCTVDQGESMRVRFVGVAFTSFVFLYMVMIIASSCGTSYVSSHLVV